MSSSAATWNSTVWRVASRSSSSARTSCGFGDRDLEDAVAGGERDRDDAVQHRQRDRLDGLGVDADDGKVDRRQLVALGEHRRRVEPAVGVVDEPQLGLVPQLARRDHDSSPR